MAYCMFVSSIQHHYDALDKTNRLGKASKKETFWGVDVGGEQNEK